MPRVHVRVKGRVQGVFFRDTTRQVAEDLGLAGWVRNLPDGGVEAVFEGDRRLCEKALDFVRRGPRAARVDHVDAVWEEEEGLKDFRIRF
jgi:acylphosphatase